MSRLSKLVVLGSIIAAGAMLLGRPRRDRATARPPAAPDPDPAEVATTSGIADVDPQPLAQIAGEGIDVDATEAAHTELAALRARLPRPGVNRP